MELLGQGRMGEVFAYGDGLVVKLDRPEWNGIAQFEAEILQKLSAAGLPVPRSEGTVELDGRTGVVMERIDGHSFLFEILGAEPEAIAALAGSFVDLQAALAHTALEGLPSLIERLAGELQLAPLAEGTRAELTALLHHLDDSSRGVCHFDFHPNNLFGSVGSWKIIDWLTVASGPPVADVMRTLLVWARQTVPSIAAFMIEVRTQSIDRYGIGTKTHDDWLRVLAGCRLAEGFEGEEKEWLTAVAAGDVRPYD